MIQRGLKWPWLVPVLVAISHPASAEIFYSGKGKEWVFLRGNVDFTLVHPLKILHGHVGDMGASYPWAGNGR